LIDLISALYRFSACKRTQVILYVYCSYDDDTDYPFCIVSDDDTGDDSINILSSQRSCDRQFNHVLYFFKLYYYGFKSHPILFERLLIHTLRNFVVFGMAIVYNVYS